MSAPVAPAALRTAAVLAGSVDAGERLVAQAEARVVTDGVPESRRERALLVWTVRAYLSRDMTLGAGTAPDVDVPPAADAALSQDVAPHGDPLTARFAAASRLTRCVAVLHWGEHQPAATIADTVGSTAEGIELFLDAVRERLDVGPGRACAEQDVRRMLHLLDVGPYVPADAGAHVVPDAGSHAVPDSSGADRPTDLAPATPDSEDPAPSTPLPDDDLPLSVRVPATLDLPVAAGLGGDLHDVRDIVDTLPVTDSEDDADLLVVPTPDAEVHLPPPPPYPSLRVVRPLVVLTTILGVNYIVWRWFFSVHWADWWIAVPLVLAETYSLVDSLLFGMTVWRLKRRPDPGPPPPDATVDVFITTYNEPIELVMATARAAQRIRHPHTLWILDDGNRPELREIAGAAGIGVISRSADWIDMPRHAKAGNLNNALMMTQGEFVVVLDADQVPLPELLDRTLGYFRDEKMAIVQTPQFFVNVPDSDPLGSQAPLFYGPLQQGKDGWNSAFFCGSNAVLRREALLQMGIRRYVQELELRVGSALATAEKVVRRARAALPAGSEQLSDALGEVLAAAQQARDELADGAAIADATVRFQDRVRAVSRRLVEADVAASQADLAELVDLAEWSDLGEHGGLSEDALERLARRDWSPLGAIETVRALIGAVDVDREDEAQPIMPMSTISVTEDMATCMRIHSMGWRTAYHDQTLAVGLAPEDVGTMLTQRLRWAQGTVQVMLRENPFRQKGLSFAQKLMYGATMWSYLSGFAALAYIAAPVIYLVFGVLPVKALSAHFFLRLVPFLLANQLLFFVIGRGRHTWRGQQYSLALFPVWIKAVTSAVGNVVLGRSLTFAVTPKTRATEDRLPWHRVRPQLFAMGLLVVAVAIGTVRYLSGQATALGFWINVVWVAFDLALFSVIPRAVMYRGFSPAHETVPDAAPAPSPAPVSSAVDDDVLEISR